jgi:hypothetical protein
MIYERQFWSNASPSEKMVILHFTSPISHSSQTSLYAILVHCLTNTMCLSLAIVYTLTQQFLTNNLKPFCNLLMTDCSVGTNNVICAKWLKWPYHTQQKPSRISTSIINVYSSVCFQHHQKVSKLHQLPQDTSSLWLKYLTIFIYMMIINKTEAHNILTQIK